MSLYPITSEDQLRSLRKGDMLLHQPNVTPVEYEVTQNQFDELRISPADGGTLTFSYDQILSEKDWYFVGP